MNGVHADSEICRTGNPLYPILDQNFGAQKLHAPHRGMNRMMTI